MIQFKNNLNCTIVFLIKMNVISEGDGRKGYPPGAPFDAIHVGAAAPVLPEDVSQ